MDETLYDWADRAGAALGLPDEAAWASERATVREILDLARDAAHGVARPAAPVASFLAGVAVGLQGAEDPAALRRAIEALGPTLATGEPDGER